MAFEAHALRSLIPRSGSFPLSTRRSRHLGQSTLVFALLPVWKKGIKLWYASAKHSQLRLGNRALERLTRVTFDLHPVSTTWLHLCTMPVMCRMCRRSKGCPINRSPIHHRRGSFHRGHEAALRDWGIGGLVRAHCAPDAGAFTGPALVLNGRVRLRRLWWRLPSRIGRCCGVYLERQQGLCCRL